MAPMYVCLCPLVPRVLLLHMLFPSWLSPALRCLSPSKGHLGFANKALLQQNIYLEESSLGGAQSGRCTHTLDSLCVSSGGFFPCKLHKQSLKQGTETRDSSLLGNALLTVVQLRAPFVSFPSGSLNLAFLSTQWLIVNRKGEAWPQPSTASGLTFSWEAGDVSVKPLRPRKPWNPGLPQVEWVL